MLRVLLIFSIISITTANCQAINELPHCVSEKSSLVYVSTLDGKLSALSSAGSLEWQIDTGPGPLLISNIHNLELTNNGEWIRIIPSLSGTLYKFDGITIDPIPISADSLLKSSFRYSDDLVIAGGVEVRTYGIGFRSGKIFYECTPTKCSNDQKQDASDDILLIERTTQIIRAVEPRSGSERWNFSVGLNDIKLSRVSCFETTKLFDWNITAVIPDGVLRASKYIENTESSWKYKFTSPIVRVWRWTGHTLEEINLFAPKVVPNILFDPVKTTTPAIYLGMHNKQLYVHESVVMQNILQGKVNTDIAVTETGNSLAKIPWMPVPASDNVVNEDSTAVSVLNGSEYVNGNGFYFYTDIGSDNESCDQNETIQDDIAIDDEAGVQEYVDYVLKFQIEIMVVIVTTLICNFIYRLWSTTSKFNTNCEQSSDSGTMQLERRISETNEQPFQSRYINDFDIIRCLGKGGFGVVFEAKQKFDEGSYAIKRITLSNKENSRNRVMREVKVLARLDHQNIVRYFGSWEERPPADWCEEHDQKMLSDLSLSAMYSSEITTPSLSVKSRRNKSTSVSINMDSLKGEQNYDDDDSFIEFADDDNRTNDNIDKEESDDSDCTAKTRSTVELCVSEHEMKKINWRRPSYKHHSWDSFQSNIIDNKQKDPPVFLYIQMQLCRKESLKEWLQENIERDYSVSLNIFKQILSAVEYVHLRGLIHRDLKPSNILFSLDGQVKVADFGLVKAMQEPCGVDTQKGTYNYNHSVNVGTMLYMSPEQLNSRKYDYKVDIYSLGLIFFELLVPFRTDSERIKVLTNIKKRIYPEEFKEQFPKEYVLIENMLNEVPEKRLTTIGIKARPPCNIKDSQYDEKYHFQLPTGNVD